MNPIAHETNYFLLPGYEELNLLAGDFLILLQAAASIQGPLIPT